MHGTLGSIRARAGEGQDDTEPMRAFGDPYSAYMRILSAFLLTLDNTLIFLWFPDLGQASATEGREGGKEGGRERRRKGNIEEGEGSTFVPTGEIMLSPRSFGTTRSPLSTTPVCWAA